MYLQISMSVQTAMYHVTTMQSVSTVRGISAVGAIKASLKMDSTTGIYTCASDIFTAFQLMKSLRVVSKQQFLSHVIFRVIK